jgi:hypothetical protein
MGDDREKYSLEQNIRVIKLYKEGMGLKSIERVEGGTNPFADTLEMRIVRAKS